MTRTPHDRDASAPPADGRAEHFDVLIVGAGLSGIAAAYHLRKRLPGKRIAILEARDALGGTWDLFRYPGVRSDSDMQTMGFSFRPWGGDVTLAEGRAIRDYIRDTARAFALDRLIRFRHRVVRASWSSREAAWTVEVERDGGRTTLGCGFLFMCSGYYEYAAGHQPRWPGVDDFRGRLVHPQSWPPDLDVVGRRVVVVGSGATAVTLVPALTAEAAHVTMLQRSPSYVVSRPRRDPFATAAHRLLPARLADAAVRWKNIGQFVCLYQVAQRWPERFAAALIAGVGRQLGPGYDVARHFTPRYKPWNQRICFAADGDLFDAIRSGRATVATGDIDRFTCGGIRLATGGELPADVVVSATGLNMRLMDGVSVEVDGAPVDWGRRFAYKSMMFSGVPNFALALGNVTGSWTLRCELTAIYVCRLLARMDRRGLAACRPVRVADAGEASSMIALQSGFVRRAADHLPKQGPAGPWRVRLNFIADMAAMRFGRLDDGVMEFSSRGVSAAMRASAVRRDPG